LTGTHPDITSKAGHCPAFRGAGKKHVTKGKRALIVPIGDVSVRKLSPAANEYPLSGYGMRE